MTRPHTHTHTHTVSTEQRRQMGNEDNDDGCQKSRNRGSERLTRYGSGAFCNLMEWWDRDVMRWYFIRIPRNLNYVFTAIKMKYYKFNNRAVSSTVWSFSSTWSIFRCFLLCCCCGFSGILCVADLVPKPARSPTEWAHTTPSTVSIEFTGIRCVFHFPLINLVISEFRLKQRRRQQQHENEFIILSWIVLSAGRRTVRLGLINWPNIKIENHCNLYVAFPAWSIN